MNISDLFDYLETRRDNEIRDADLSYSARYNLGYRQGYNDAINAIWEYYKTQTQPDKDA